MKWFNRCLWLSAWSFWLWLGFGLHRELPRKFGEPIAKLEWKVYRAMGYVGDTNLFAMQQYPDPKTTQIDAFDVETGKLAYSVRSPSPTNFIWASTQNPHNPALLANDVDGKGLFILDMRLGEWKRLSDERILLSCPHPSKRCFATMKMVGQPDSQRQRVELFDWDSLKATTVCEVGSGDSLVFGMHFTEDGERLLLHTLATKENSSVQFSFDVWNINAVPSFERRLFGVPDGVQPTSSLNGRIAFANPVKSFAVEVFDLRDGRRLFANFPDGERPSRRPPKLMGVLQPAISPSGRTILAGNPAVLSNVETGKVVWRDRFGFLAYADVPANRFEVDEWWSELWKEWLPTLSFRTYAIRDIETGNLIVRIIEDGGHQGGAWNQRGTLALGSDLKVFRLPLPPNYSLLALCQTILALPLIFLWAILRWRSRRAVRRQPAVVSQPETQS